MAKPAKKIHTIVKQNSLTGEPSQVLEAVQEMVEFLKPTLGPKIQHILVNRGYKTELMDDGVSIAQEFEMDDPFKDAVCDYVKEISRKTDDRAGDGTTTTMILLGALLEEISRTSKQYPEIRKELEAALIEARQKLSEASLEVADQETLFKVAKTSMNDDEIAKIVAEVVWQAGAKGAISITDSTGRDVTYEKVEGFTINRGFLARGMITNRERQMYEAPNKNFPGALGIFYSEQVISTGEDILPILEKAQANDLRNIVIFCPNLIGEALGVVAFNQAQGRFNIVAVPLPSQGEKAKDLIQDLRAVIGFDDAKGYGTAERVEVSVDDTTIIGGAGNPEEIKEIIDHLLAKAEETKDDYEKDYYHMRQARLHGGVVVIRVGGLTDTEINLRLKKIEDAVNACKCALEEGIVPGAGITLYNLETSCGELNRASQEVFKTLLTNAQLKLTEVPTGSETINTVTGEIGDFLSVGVVDATKVIRTALENAVSLAIILSSVAGIITNKPDDN